NLTFGRESYHPRPQQRRRSWHSLNGLWDFYIDVKGAHTYQEQIQWNSNIEVPFSPETAASGIGETGFYAAVWYRRSFERPIIAQHERLILHFEAVDYRATVWINGAKVCSHEGGYTPFSVDITDALHAAGLQEIVVRAEDDPSDLAKPRGKQDWKLEPHSI